jgi:hypothetical protein
MSEGKKRYKACRRIFKYVNEAIKKLEKAENENTEWQCVPSEVFEEIISVLGKVGTEVTKSKA